MSEQAYLMARISKSYINGAWQPITGALMPKARLKRAVKAGRFGQGHLKDVDNTMNAIRNNVVRSYQTRRANAVTSGTVGNVHPSAKRKGGAVMDRIVGNKGADMAGPHVNWATAPGQRHQIRLADKESMGQVKDQVHLLRSLGAKDTMDDIAGTNAHEMAHAGRSKRNFTSRAAADMQRNLDKEKGPLSADVAAQKRKGGPTSRQRMRSQASLQRIMVRSAKSNVGEEARADVMATRQTGRHFVSGHTLDTGDPGDYLAYRNKIERGMKMPQTKRNQVYKP